VRITAHLIEAATTAPLQQLFARCFYLVLRADSLSAAQTYHLGARDSGFQALMLHYVLRCVLRHSHKTATPRMFADICNDPYTFHTHHVLSFNTDRCLSAAKYLGFKVLCSRNITREVLPFPN
jgi:hypothetical protein